MSYAALKDITHQHQIDEQLEDVLTLERIDYLSLGLAHTEHHAGLSYPHALLLGTLKHSKALPEPCTAVAHEWRERLHSLDVMRVHVEPGSRNERHVLEFTRKVAGERLDEDLRSLLLDLSYRLREMVRSAVRKI